VPSPCSADNTVEVTNLRINERERGASLVEYALLIALLAVVCFAAVDFLGTSTSGELSRFGSSLSSAGN
jgi:pilus assembly protein Flp/PilA